MRRDDVRAERLSSYVIWEARVPASQSLRRIRAIVDQVLKVLWDDLEEMHAKTGRPSISPEKLLRARLLQALHSIRSKRHLMEQIDYNMLFRWSVGLSMDSAVWDAIVFTKNRDWLLARDVVTKFMGRWWKARDRQVCLSFRIMAKWA